MRLPTPIAEVELLEAYRLNQVAEVELLEAYRLTLVGLKE